MKLRNSLLSHVGAGLILLGVVNGAFGQSTPSQDAYTNSATPTSNFGTAATLGVVSSTASIQSTYIQFDLSGIPSGYSGSNVAKATLKLYVNAVTTAGSFNVDFVNGAWTEKSITADLTPALGTTIASGVPLTSANVHDYVSIDVTAAVVDWLNGTQANDGIALVANSPLNASLDSKENTTQSHPAELDLVLTGNGTGTITGVTTTSGSGLAGGGTTGTLNLSLTTACASGQVLQWSGAAWTCSAAGSGTVTSVGSGTGLIGGPITSGGTLSIDTTKVPLLSVANTFTANQTVNGNLTASGTVTASGFQIGSNLFDFGSRANGNAFLGFAGNSTMTGGNNTATGASALSNNTTGIANTASGSGALLSNTTGTYNTASGINALYSNGTGSYNTASGTWALQANGKGSANTALGYLAGPDAAHPNLNNATAIGANSQVTASNAMVLGSINGVNGATADTNVGIGTTAPLTLLHVNHTVPPGGADLLAVTSGGSLDVASLLLQNTGAGGLFLRAGAGTGETYLASSGPLAFITAPTASPSGPGTPAMTIDTLGNVDVSAGLMRIDNGGLSLGGAAPVAVDAPGTVGGRFAILANGNVGINNPAPASTLDVAGNAHISGSAAVSSLQIHGDIPMSSNPRMTFSASFPGGFCNSFNCGSTNTPGFPGGYLVVDQTISITRIDFTMAEWIDSSCIPPSISVSVGSSSSNPVVSYPLPTTANFADFVVFPRVVVPAGTYVWVYLSPLTEGCNLGAPGGGNGFATIQYVMQ